MKDGWFLLSVSQSFYLSYWLLDDIPPPLFGSVVPGGPFHFPSLMLRVELLTGAVSHPSLQFTCRRLTQVTFTSLSPPFRSFREGREFNAP